jgi:hypothetical protein
MQRSPLLHFAVSRGPNVLVQCIAVNRSRPAICVHNIQRKFWLHFPSALRYASYLTEMLFIASQSVICQASRLEVTSDGCQLQNYFYIDLIDRKKNIW